MSFNEMTLGEVMELNILENENKIKEIFEKAQGEMALEKVLEQIKETWSSYTLELMNYQNKCRLIKGWEELLTQISDNLGSLNSMKMSPYYKIFEEQVLSWEDKLVKI